MQNKDQEKLILAKLNDKIRLCKTRNRIVNTEFLNMYQENIIKQELDRIKEKNYIITGGFEDAESKILVVYPEKIPEEIAQKSIHNLIVAIKIVLPNEQNGRYMHKDYLGTIMQFGLERERIGDIIVYDNKAYVLTMRENAEYIKSSLQETSKFKKSKIEIIDISEIEVKEKEFEEIKITINTPRLDNFVSEITKNSRNETTKLIQSEQVFVNCKVETKQSKIIEKGDILIIRRSGKFIVSEFKHINKKGKQIVLIKKYK